MEPFGTQWQSLINSLSLLVLDKFVVHLKNGQPYLLLCKTLIEDIEGAKEVEGSTVKDPRASGRFAQSWTGTAWG